MSFEPPSPPPAQPAITPVEAPSFAEVIPRIGGWTDLSETRRRDMVSALRTAARLLGRRPEAIPCDVAWLNQHLFARPPAAFGLERGRFTNITSLLRAVLRRLGRHAPPRYGDEGMSTEWALLIGIIAQEGQRAGLRGFARHCSEREIAPGTVTDAVLADYAALDAATRLSTSATDRAQRVVAAWNAAVRAALPGWPAVVLKAPRKREPYTLPLDAYPPSFGTEVEAFRARLTGADESGKRRGRYLLDPDGPRRTLRPATVKARLFAIRQAAGILVQLGVAAGEIRSLRDLIDPLERVGAILEFLAERHAQKNGLPDGVEVRGGQVAQVAETLRQIAQYHCKLMGEPLAQIREAARLAGSRKQSGMARKVRDRLHAMVQPRPRALILHLPDELMRRARRLAALGRQRDAGRHALWAVALEILLFCPLRQGTLRRLRLDRHLVHLDPRSRLPSRLSVRGEDTKNAEPVDWPIPKASAALLGEYLETFRPAIAAPDNPFLLPGEDGGGQRSANALANALVGLINELCGVRVTLHMVRHFAAWRYLKEHPGHYEDVRRLLGHRDAATTMAFYVAFETEAVAARFDGMILKEKRQTRALAAAAFGKQRRGWR